MSSPNDPSVLQQPIQFLKGVGPARAELLAKLGIATVADLIFHFPRSYDDLSDVRGFDESLARRLLAAAGLAVDIVDSVLLKDVPSGVAAGTLPTAGESLQVGRGVTLQLAR